MADTNILSNIYKNSEKLLNTNTILSGNVIKTINNLINNPPGYNKSQKSHAQNQDIPNKYNKLNKYTKHTRKRKLNFNNINSLKQYTNTNTNTNTLNEQTEIDKLNTIINSSNTPNTSNTTHTTHTLNTNILYDDDRNNNDDSNNNGNPSRNNKQINTINTNNTNNTNNIANKYKILNYIGKGIHGKLYIAHDRSNNNNVICKQITINGNKAQNTHQTEQIQFELQILKYLANNITTRDYINPCLDHKIINNNVYTFFPIFNGYNLIHFKKYLSKLPYLTYYNLIFYLIKLLLHGMAQIHSANISHQNITEDCILISSSNDITNTTRQQIKKHANNANKLYIKFIDFGLGCGNSAQTQSQSRPHILSSCNANNNVPIIINNAIKPQLTDMAYLQLSQHFDVLALGVIFIKLLLHHFEDINIDISKGYNNNVKKIIHNIINKYTAGYKQDKSKLKNIQNNKNNLLRNLAGDSPDDSQSQLPYVYAKLHTIEAVKRKQLIRNIKNYIKIFSNYIFCNTNERQPLHYILDKLIIYEKYNN